MIMRQEKIRKILESILKIKLDNKTDIKLVEIKSYDSLRLVEIILEIQSIDNKKIPLNKLNKIFTIDDLLKL
tara:strand:+ start:181 stop:396 length:216 start_codon:yes stop_codon:yes gene_type:complete